MSLKQVFPDPKTWPPKINRAWEKRECATPKRVGLQIVPDIQPYRAIAADIQTGRPPNIGSRREHKEFLRRNNYSEVGNEKQKHTHHEMDAPHDDIRRAINEVKNR